MRHHRQKEWTDQSSHDFEVEGATVLVQLNCFSVDAEHILYLNTLPQRPIRRRTPSVQESDGWFGEGFIEPTPRSENSGGFEESNLRPLTSLKSYLIGCILKKTEFVGGQSEYVLWYLYLCNRFYKTKANNLEKNINLLKLDLTKKYTSWRIFLNDGFAITMVWKIVTWLARYLDIYIWAREIPR